MEQEDAISYLMSKAYCFLCATAVCALIHGGPTSEIMSDFLVPLVLGLPVISVMCPGPEGRPLRAGYLLGFLCAFFSPEPADSSVDSALPAACLK